jgi:hypothetical protein
VKLLVDYKNIVVFYTVFEALITEIEVIDSIYFSDNDGSNKLVELEYMEFGRPSTVILNCVNEDLFEIHTINTFITTDLRSALKVAVKGYKTLALKRPIKQDMEKYFHKYYNDFPEVFI